MVNTTPFTDKQIMDLTSASTVATTTTTTATSTSTAEDFLDLINKPPQNDNENENNQSFDTGGYTGNFPLGGSSVGVGKEEIVPSYDFHPIRPVVFSSSSSPSPDSSTAAVIGGGSSTSSGAIAHARVWNSAESKSNPSTIRNYSSLDSFEVSKTTLEKDHNALETSIVSEVDKAMKNYMDNLLHALEGVSARLTQLESRARNLENSVDDLKVSVGNNHGSTDGKMRQLENILREVQTGVQAVKDKQEIMQAQLHLAKLQVSKPETHQLEAQNSTPIDALPQAASAPLQSNQQHMQPPISIPQPIPPPSIPQQQTLPPPPPLPKQFPQNQVPSVSPRDPYYSPPTQTQEPPNPPPQYQVPPSQPQLSPPAPPHQQYQPVAPHPPYPQPHQPPQTQVTLGQHSEEILYAPPQSYPPNLRQQAPQPPPGGAPPPQPYVGAPSHAYEPPSGRTSSGFSGAYGPPPPVPETYPYGGSPSQYGSGPVMKPQQFSSGAAYPQLPMARILPQALPTATGVGSGAGSPRSGNRVPLDDVIDKVATMGFPRDHVRAAVRKLTENGQSVDLNVVLDKLMNDSEYQPQRGWLGR